MQAFVAIPILAAGSAPEFLVELVELVIAAAVVAYVCHRLGLVPIVGFLVAGILIGPSALGLVQDPRLIEAASEIGVMLLLFTIGIEFSLEKLARIKGLIFGGGGLQLLLTTAAVAGVLVPFGVEAKVAVFTGFLVTLSSTAIVLKLLSSRGETGTTVGRVGLGLLIFQDLAIIVMVMLVPILAGEGGSAGGVLWALGKAGMLITVVLWAARKLMPIILEKVAQTCSTELFLLTVIAICFGTAYLTSLADVSVSLGAFLAGLVVSESRFSQHAFGEILPLQMLFSATFFVSVGLLLDLGFLAAHFPVILGLVAAVLVLKIATTFLSVVILRYPVPVAAASALMLAQVGEFSFVLQKAGGAVGLTPAGLGERGVQSFVAAAIVLMVLTPFLTDLGMRLAGKLRRREERRDADRLEDAIHAEENPRLENHVILAGFGDAARKLARVLVDSEIALFVVTLRPEGATEAERLGMPVLRGDATKPRTLHLAGIERAKVLLLPDDDPAAAHRIAAVARVANPTLLIIARTRLVSEIEPLAEAGVDRVVPEELESIVALLAAVLHDYHLPIEEIDSNLEAVRSGHYSAIRRTASETGRRIDCHSLDSSCLNTRTVTLRAGAPVVGQTLASLGLPHRHGILVTSVRRGEVQHNTPAASFVLEERDQVEMSGTAAAFEAAADLFRGEDAEAADAVPPSPGDSPFANPDP
jgi:CPA2 family monovalent cation:H+ antiporter-2